MAPVAFLIGVPWQEAVEMGSLLGTKVVLNEFVAYLQLSEMVEQGVLSPKTISMATFALCGFANLDRKSTRLNSSHVAISYAVFCLKKKNLKQIPQSPIMTTASRYTVA